MNIIKALKKYLPDVAAVALFLVISFAYFFTPVTKGLVLSGHDNTGGVGAGVEINAYRDAHNGDTPRWTGVLFAGMPTYQLAPSYGSTDALSMVKNVYSLFTTGAMMYVFILLLGFYIMMRAFDFRAWMAVLGAIVWAFSSYFFIIIGAGHLWKALTLAFIPPTIAGMVLCYRGRLLAGTALTGFFAALQVLSNHVQMTYYFLPVFFVIVLAYGIKAWREHSTAQWVRATACIVVGGMLGVAVNLSNLYHTYEYSKHTMRAKSELTARSVKDAANQTASGLDRDYITAWSYGIDETWTLLVPGCKGGMSGASVSQSKTAMAKANSQFVPIYQQLPQYWGEQPMTAGPVYVGAFVVMLAILALFICRTPLTYGLAALTLLSILLSWGRNFMPFTDFFIDHVPMYDKFRTVSSILVVAEFTLPLMAMLTLRRIINQPEVLRQNLKWLYASFALTGIVALVMAWVPSLFFDSFISTNESNMLNNAAQAGYIPQEALGGILANLTEMRQAVLTSECYRTFIVVATGTLILLIYNAGKCNAKIAVGAITLLCLVDMWMVNKRYLNDGMFQRPANRAAIFTATPTDEAINTDADINHRVLNLASNTFNENETSYHHKSIGGYHPAKLRRYQELIEHHIAPQMSGMGAAISRTAGRLDSLSQAQADSLFPVLNMLNTRYVIVPLQGGETAPVPNPHAMGNAWFVSDIDYVATADDEIDNLATRNLRTTAIIASQYRADTEGTMGEGTIKQTSYQCDALSYDVQTDKGGLLVMSEIYYPGWRAYITPIDGASQAPELPVACADYVLRCVRIPAGHYTLDLRFDPQSLHITETIAYISLIILALLLIAALWKMTTSAYGKER